MEVIMRLLSCIVLFVIAVAVPALAADASKNRLGLYGVLFSSEAETIAHVKKCREHGIGMQIG